MRSATASAVMSSSRLRPADRVRPTVAALATPPGQSALAVIRVSGPDALPIVDRLVPGCRIRTQPSHTVRLGWCRDSAGKPIDQVLVTVFRSPRSYTGEDMAEISCHGGLAAPAAVLDRLFELGCQSAEPGEFTRRAVLAGKLTVAQAEAVLEIINAQSPAALRAATKRYQGQLAEFVAQTGAELSQVLVELEYSLLDDGPLPPLNRRLGRLAAGIERELALASQNRFLYEGAKVAIVGRPNVGKSSLFNRLLGTARTIENRLPHTTRDAVSADVMIGDIRVRLTDTAGLSARPVPALTLQAQAKTRQAIAEADLVLVVLDRSLPSQRADRLVLAETATRPRIVVLNKADRPDRLGPAAGLRPRVAVSCRTGAGLTGLRRLLAKRLAPGAGIGLVAGERQLAVLRDCLAAVERSRTAPNAEIAALEIRQALDMLAQLDIRFPTQAILDQVFARFCVGK